MERLLTEKQASDFEKHEALFLKNFHDHANPFDSEDLTDHQKEWLLKLDQKYK